jgi:GntR family transcriptional regulator/MocR family aminotransferase
MRIAATEIRLAPTPGRSLQMRIREAVSSAVWDGRFRAGDRLPATRALAAHLGVARITVGLAYEELAAEGWLKPEPRRGWFVAEDAPRAPPLAPEVEGPGLDWALRLGPEPPALGAQAKPADWRRFAHPFVFGQPDPEGFPLDDWRFCARRALGRAEFDAVAGDVGDRDDPMLVEEIARRGLAARGVRAAPEQILVTSGAQNALWLAAELVLKARPGALAAVEEPGYPETRHMLRRLGARLAPVPVDAEGVRPDAIPPEAALVVVTPSHQAPTGATLSAARRTRLLALAEAHDWVILEDDYDFETVAPSPGAPALKAEDRRGRVIHVGSFSKSVFPGLRLGFLHGDAAFVRRARAVRTLSSRHPPGLTQRTAAHFLALGLYDAHVAALRRRLDARRAALTAALAAEGIAPPAAPGGAALWLEGPRGLDAGRLAERLRPRGVLIEPGAPFFAAEPPPRRFLRLGLSAIPEARIAPGVAILAEEMRRLR